MKETENDAENMAELAAKFINQTDRHIFLTGKAGTGKTTFLKHIIHHTHKKCVVAAPTGIAAVNAGGVTLHSLFQLPFGTFVPDNQFSEQYFSGLKISTPQSFIKSLQMSITKRILLQETELLIIDEVSMLRADLLDAVDTVLRSVRRRHAVPFGGLQILFIGDLLQLPPVVKEEEQGILARYYRNAFFYEALALQNNKPVLLELNKIYRQKDSEFTDLLNRLRENQIEPKDIETLNKRYLPDAAEKAPEECIRLTTHNRKADRINEEALRKLPGISRQYYADIDGEFNESAYPISPKIELKLAARVMFVKNDSSGEKRFFNGLIGKITDMGNEYVVVKPDDGGEKITVEKQSWDNIRYKINPETREPEEEHLGTFRQLPLKPAWAVTVHKSQGLTFQKAVIDLENAFAPGQIYVALSRLTTLDGLILSAPVNYSVLSMNTDAAEYTSSQSSANDLQKILESETRVYLKSYLLKLFNFEYIQNELSVLEHVDATDERRSVKLKYLPKFKEINTKFEKPLEIASKFRKQVTGIIDSGNPDYKALLYDRLFAAQSWFQPVLSELSKGYSEIIHEIGEEKKTKTLVKELTLQSSILNDTIIKIQKAVLLLKSILSNTEYSKTEENSVKPQTNSSTQGKSKKEKKAKIDKIPTHEETFNLYKKGLKLSEIALERKLTMTTIEGHAAKLITEGKIKLNELVDEEKNKLISDVILKLKSVSLSEIKRELPENISFGAIKMVMAGMGEVKEVS